MKLLSCEIAGFGVLRNETRTFTDGLNCVCAPNGEGKSTLAVFIKAMLYGLPQSTKRKLNDNERKRYQPWDGGIYGGSLTFEVHGKRYRAERFFGAKESEDTFALTNLDTNLPGTEYSANLGYELFGIGADAYERSTYISQRILADKPEDNDLRVKLTHLIEESGDFSTLESALDILNKKRSEYLVRGGRGLIGDTDRDLQTTESEIIRLRGECDSLRRFRASLREETGKSEQLRAAREQYEKTLRALADEKAKREITARMRELETERDRLRKEVDTTAARLGTPLPTKEEIAAKRTDCERLIRLSAEIDATRLSPEDTTRLDSLSARFTDGCPTEETIESARASLAEATTLESENQNLRVQAETLRSIAKIRKEAQKAQKKPVPKAVYLIPALVLLIAAIPLFALSLTVPAVIVLAAGLLCGAAGVVLAAREKPEPVEPETDDDGTAEYERKIAENSRRAAELRGDVLKLTGEGSDPSTALSRLAADVREYRTLADRKTVFAKKRETLESESDALSDRVKAYLARWFDPDSDKPSALLVRLEALLDRYASLVADAKNAEERAVHYREEHRLPDPLPENSENDLPDEAGLNAERDRIARETDLVNAEIARLGRLIEERADAEEELSVAEARADDLKEAGKRYRENLDVIKETVKYLSAARDNLSARYLGTMQDSFRKYFAALTGTDSGAYEMNADFEVTYRENGRSYSAEYLSRGMRDAILVCTRLALADALFEGEKPFLVLDDPLVNLDDEKQKNAGALLRAAAEDYQILYFVCSRSRM